MNHNLDITGMNDQEFESLSRKEQMLYYAARANYKALERGCHLNTIFGNLPENYQRDMLAYAYQRAADNILHNTPDQLSPSDRALVSRLRNKITNILHNEAKLPLLQQLPPLKEI